VNKHELRRLFGKYEALTLFRLRNEEAIINAIPHALNVTRVRPPNRMDAPENGLIEIEADDCNEALGLIRKHVRLAPVPLTCVEMDRDGEGHTTTSFIPTCRIPMRHHTATGVGMCRVYPIVIQLAPSNTLDRPRVTFEWYAEVAKDVIVNVRATVKEHPVVWKIKPTFHPCETTWGDYSSDVWSWVGAPRADHVRVTTNLHHERPFVTLWWRPFAEAYPGHMLGSLAWGKEGQPSETTD
jgi:hypothetical protein